MKLSLGYVILAFFVILALLIAAVGFMGLNLKGSEATRSTVDVEVNVAARAMDLFSGKPVTGVPIYFLACCPDDQGTREINASDVTGADGWALFATNYTLDTGQVIYLGASNRKPLVVSDFAGRDFNGTGLLGAWKSFNYTLLYNSVDNKARIDCIITIDYDSGKMI